VEAVAAAAENVAEGDDGLERLETTAAQARQRFAGRDKAVRSVLA
jgi:hypothetical protein